MVEGAPPGTLADLLADNGIPDASRMFAAYIATHDTGDGLELRHDDVAAILYGWPKADKIRDVIRPAVLSGYVSRNAGGRDHGDTFGWAGVPLGSGKNPTLNLGSVPRPQPKADSMGAGPQPKVLASGSDPTLNAPPSSSTLPSSAPPEAEPSARRFIAEHRDVFSGCRKPLLDYLAERVDRGRQLAYAQSVMGIIQGADESVWMDRGGERLHDERQEVICGCLNDLRSCDEVGRYFTHPPGHIDNLRKKIRFKARSILGAMHDAPRTSEQPTAQASATWMDDDDKMQQYLKIKAQYEERGMDTEKASARAMRDMAA